MALLRDASSLNAAQSLLSTGGGAGESGTSSSFSPPAGSLITIMQLDNSAAAATPTFTTPTNTGTALTWSNKGSKVNASGGSCVTWQAFNTNAQSGITVTAGATTLGSSVINGTPTGAFYVDVWTGAKNGQAGAAAAASGTSTSSPTSAAITTLLAGSNVIVGYIDFDATATPTTSDSGTGYLNSGQTAGIRTFKTVTVAAGAQTSSITETAPIVATWLALEIVADPGGFLPLMGQICT